MTLDLTGQRFGKLVALYRIGTRNGGALWLCQCDCGNKKEAASSWLRCGETWHCGCVKYVRPTGLGVKDMVGQRFGKLVVVSLNEETTKQKHGAYWNCLCDCGNTYVTKGYNLRKGITKSCGCLRTLSVNHNYFKTWTNEMAWILGFWAADGCIRKKGSNNSQDGISFGQKNKDIITEIKTLLDSKHKVSCEERKQFYTLTFSSSETHKDLCSIFCVDNLYRKSLTIPFPEIEDKFAKDFIRGCIDGDGCVGFNNKGIPIVQFCSGSENFMDGFINLVKETTGIRGIKTSRTKNESTSYYAHYYHIRAKCLILWIYDTEHIALERKKGKVPTANEWNPSFVKQSSLTPKMCAMFSHLIPQKYIDRCLEERQK